MRLLYYLRLTRNIPIIRRYFVINSFDGAITILGILLGSFLVGVQSPVIIIGAGMGAAIALAVSGISSAYLSEKAEMLKELEELEKAMLRKLHKTRLGEAARAVPLITAMVNGLSPFIVSVIILLPFLLSRLIETSIENLYYSSFVLCFVSLFALGIYMGKFSKKSLFLCGLKTVLVGVITAAILLLLKLIF